MTRPGRSPGITWSKRTMTTTKYEIGVHSFDVEAAEGFADSSAGEALGVAAAVLREYHDASAEIGADKLLSQAGKAKKVEPLAGIAWDAVAQAASELARLETGIDDAERQMLAVGEPDTPYQISRDEEVRRWWRGLTEAERWLTIEDMGHNPAKYDGVMRAVLRSPIPADLGVASADGIRSLNAQLRRLENPGLADSLDRGRVNLESAKAGMAHAVGITKRLTGKSASDHVASLRKAGRHGEATALARLAGVK